MGLWLEGKSFENSLFRFCNDLIELALNNEVEYG